MEVRLARHRPRRPKFVIPQKVRIPVVVDIGDPHPPVGRPAIRLVAREGRAHWSDVAAIQLITLGPVLISKGRRRQRCAFHVRRRRAHKADRIERRGEAETRRVARGEQRDAGVVGDAVVGSR